MVEVRKVFNPVSKSETTNILAIVSEISFVEGSRLTMKNSTARKAPLAEWLETSADQTGITQSIAPTPIPAMTRAFCSQHSFFMAKIRAMRQPKRVPKVPCPGNMGKVPSNETTQRIPESHLHPEHVPRLVKWSKSREKGSRIIHTATHPCDVLSGSL